MKKSNLMLILIAIVVIIVIIIGLFYLNQNQNKESETIKIGSILPLTNDLASFGQGARNAIELAIDEINAAGGVNGKKLEIIFEDGRCNAADAVTAAQKLINVDKVSVILGGFCSAETLAAAPLTEQNKVILFSPGSSSPKITHSGDYIFRDFPSDDYQGKYAAEVAYNKLGKRKAAVFYVQVDYGIGVKDAFEKRFKELGGEIVDEESFLQTSRDFRTQLVRIKGANPDVVYYPSYSDAIIPGLKQIKEIGITSQILGTEVFDDPSIIQQTGNSSEGIIYVLQYSPLREDFKKAMKTKTGSDDVLVGSANSYDAVYIIVDIIKKVGTNSTKIKDELYKVKNYDGVSGTITLDSNGDLISASYMTKEIKNGKTSEVKL